MYIKYVAQHRQFIRPIKHHDQLQISVSQISDIKGKTCAPAGMSVMRSKLWSVVD